MNSMEDIFLEKIELDLPSRKLLSRIKPVLDELLCRENKRLKEFNPKDYTTPEWCFEEIQTMLFSMIHCLNSPKVDRNTQEKVIGEMFQEKIDDPEGEAAIYQHLSYTLTKKAIDLKDKFIDPCGADYFTEYEYWAIYILLRLQDYTNGGGRRHLDMAYYAAFLASKKNG